MTTFAGHLLGEDTHANRPAATAVPEGTLYSCSDHSIVYQSDGATWSDWATLAGQASSALKITTSVRNESGATLTAGTPVYISGFNVGQDIIEVEAADSTSEATLPAIGLVEEDIANSATGTVVLIGNVEALDTSSYTSGDKLYVSETAGELTTTKPTGAALVQLMGEVLRSNATTGQIEVTPGLVSNSGFAATLLDDPDAATARATLGAPALTPTVNTVVATGATEDIDFGTEVHDLTMDQACSFTFSGAPASGDAGSTDVIVRGAFTPTWPAAVVWDSGTEPTYASPTVYTFLTVDGGTTIFGFAAGTGMA